MQSDLLSQLSGPVVVQSGDVPILLLDSIMVAGEAEAGAIVVSGSHGGVSAGEHAASLAIVAAFFNDAGVGCGEAGIAGLACLDRAGIVGGTVSHDSARIGDALDSWESGVLSHLNETATQNDFRAGQPLKQEILRYLERH